LTELGLLCAELRLLRADLGLLRVDALAKAIFCLADLRADELLRRAGGCGHCGGTAQDQDHHRSLHGVPPSTTAVDIQRC
jgi:hypothetical protein